MDISSNTLLELTHAIRNNRKSNEILSNEIEMQNLLKMCEMGFVSKDKIKPIVDAYLKEYGISTEADNTIKATSHRIS